MLSETGAECVDLGFKYITGKDVKQDDFKALKFFQKACGLNDGSGCLKSSCLTPLPFSYISPS
jgi:TPR repeat protein